MRTQIIARVLLACAISSASGVAFAQAAIEEVIVTATKRAESIQDVPVSVSAISGAQIENLGIGDMEDLSLFVPNFEINSASILPNLYMRGLGGGATHSIEQSVGRFVDGVYIGRAAINLHGFMDLESVEVLRGPQGTLFGKNTAGGALIMNSANPTSSFESGFTVSTSEYSTTGGNNEIQAFVSGPLSDNWAGRIAVKLKETDGYYINRLEGPGGPNREDSGVRVKLAWTPSDRTSVDFKYEYNEFESVGADTAEIGAIGGPPLFVYQIPSPNFTPTLDWIIDVDCTDIFANRDTDGDGDADTEFNAGSFCPSRDQDSSNFTMTIEHEFSGGTLTSITAYQDYDYKHNFLGLDMGLASAFRAKRNETYENLSQEFRYTSNESDTFDYIVGAYFEDSEVSRNQRSDVNLVTIFNDPSGAYVQRNEPWTQDTSSLALFGQVRWHFDNDLSLILGGRYASEDKDFAFERFYNDYGTENLSGFMGGGPFGPPLAVTGSRSEDKFTGSATLQWDANDNSMFYVALSQGHKTGGFSDRIDVPGANFEFDEENVDSIELGTKATFLNGALALNVAVFSMDIEGLQLATQLPGAIPAFSVSNAADSTSEGLELDATWRVSDVWTLGANAAFTDASYDSFPGSENCPPGVTPGPSGTCDLAGFPLIFAPDSKYTVFADFLVEDAIGGWGFAGRADYTRSDEQYTDISYRDDVITPSFSITNASLRLISPNDRATVSLIGRNLGDEAYAAWNIPSGPNILSSMNPPREVMLKLSLRFD
ncbi:MAG: TonB-dependent receptor [Woeseia sp.]|nr:TonB-dependent receptor [Woeseia sp.]NNE60945.1 TonB-dependent receptor [Woeseia sp.]NNL53979.1 TonB-dependent receptor [Woeseia sp.]